MEMSGLTQLGIVFWMVLGVDSVEREDGRRVSLTILHRQMYLLAVRGAVGTAAAVTARARVSAHDYCCWGFV